MRVLVTGGSGYIGTHLVHALLQRGDGVCIYDLAVPPAVLRPAVAYCQGDVEDEAALADCFAAEGPFDAVCHLAARVAVGESVEHPLRYYRTNVLGLCHLLTLAVEKGVRSFVFSSTAAVYQGREGQAALVPMNEDAALIPSSPYGWSKLMGERMLIDACRAHTGLTGVILRYFNVAGADPEGYCGQPGRAASHLIKIACQAALGVRAGVTVHGTDYPTPDGTGVRDYLHVSDLSQAHLLILDRLHERTAEEGRCHILNCGYGKGYSVREVLQAVQAEAGVEFSIDEGPRRAGDSPALIADASRLAGSWGWEPRFADLRQMVRHALAWERTLW